MAKICFTFGIRKVQGKFGFGQRKLPTIAIDQNGSGTPKDIGNLNLAGSAVNHGGILHFNLIEIGQNSKPVIASNR